MAQPDSKEEIVFHSSVPDVVIPVTPVTDHTFANYVDGWRDKEALIDGPTGRTVTFSQLRKQIRSVGSALTRRRFRKPEVICIYSPNVIEFAAAFHGIVSIGGIVSTANPLYTAGELAHQLEHCNAKYLIAFAGVLDKAIEAVKHAKNVQEILVFGAVPPGIAATIPVTPFDSLLSDDGGAYPKVEIDAIRDVAALLYSSGTTGLPKAVELTHFNLVANQCQSVCDPFVKLSPADTLIGVLPLFHVYGLQMILNFALREGARIVLVQRFEPEPFLKVLQDYKITIAHVVPPIVLFLAKHPLVEKYDMTSLREVFSGAAPLGKELTEALLNRKAFKLQIIRQGYGMTELSPATHITRMNKVVLGSCGALLPNILCKIVDTTTGSSLPSNKSGEICVKGPMVMKGYLNDEKSTAATIDVDGWLHTGDVGYVDEDGNFFIVDRVKELIKFKGFQVAPAELEAILLSNPKIADAAVIPKPDLEAGEVPKAFVVRSDPTLTESDVMSFIEKQVAPYKKLREVEFVAAIPKTPSGKILRRELRDKERKACADAMTT